MEDQEQMLAQSDNEDMVELRNEECLSSETLMWIDSASVCEDIFTICGFAVILVLTILTGTAGPPSINWQKSERKFTDKEVQQFHFDAAPISSYNRFIKFDFTYLRANENVTLDLTEAPFSYVVNAQDKEGTKVKLNSTISNYKISGPVGKKETPVLHLFLDKAINYQAIELVVKVTKPNKALFKGIAVKTSLGTHDHTTFQAYFRFVYTAFQLVSLYMLYDRIKKVPISGWHFEQKILFSLIIVAAFWNNPFYIIEANKPSRVYGFIDAITSAAFEADLVFTILSLFDFLKKKNQKTDMSFYLPKIVAGGFVGLSVLIHELYNASKSYTKQYIFEDKTERGLLNFEIFTEIVFVIYLVILMVQAGIAIDMTERYRYVMFTSAGCVVIFSYLMQIFARGLNLNQDTEVNFICHYCSNNVFILMLIYFHWPYEVQTDQTYVDSVDENKVVPAEMFINAELNEVPNDDDDSSTDDDEAQEE